MSSIIFYIKLFFNLIFCHSRLSGCWPFVPPLVYQVNTSSRCWVSPDRWRPQAGRATVLLSQQRPACLQSNHRSSSAAAARQDGQWLAGMGTCLLYARHVCISLMGKSRWSITASLAFACESPVSCTKQQNHWSVLQSLPKKKQSQETGFAWKGTVTVTQSQLYSAPKSQVRAVHWRHCDGPEGHVLPMMVKRALVNDTT